MKESVITTLARVLRRRMGIAIVCALIVPATAVVYSSLQEKEYTATASLLFRDPGFAQKLFGQSLFTPSSDPDREAATNLRLVSLGVVAKRTAEEIGGELTRRDVAGKVEASSEGQSNVVAIRATDPSPRQAAELANTFAQEYIAFRRDADRKKIEETLAIISGQLDALSPAEARGPQGQELKRQRKQLSLFRSLQTGNAELVEPASLPTSPSSPRTTRNLIVGVLVGLMLGLGMAFLVDRLDRRLRDVDEIETIFGRPILAQVPKDRTLGDVECNGERLSPGVAETFHMLRANLRYFHSREPVESVLVASAIPEEGKTTIAWNLAVAAAGTGTRVLFLETDLRQPDMASHLDLPAAPGLSELLADVATFDSVTHRLSVAPSSGPSKREHVVDVIAAGKRPPNPADLIESDQMWELLVKATESYDLVVIDSPPATVVSDVVPLLDQVGGVLVVVRLGKSTRSASDSLKKQLDYFEARTLGVVVNMTGKGPELYGYGDVGDHEAEEAEEKKKKKKAEKKTRAEKKTSAETKKAEKKTRAEKKEAEEAAAEKKKAEQPGSATG